MANNSQRPSYDNHSAYLEEFVTPAKKRSRDIMKYQDETITELRKKLDMIENPVSFNKGQEVKNYKEIRMIIDEKIKVLEQTGGKRKTRKHKK